MNSFQKCISFFIIFLYSFSVGFASTGEVITRSDAFIFFANQYREKVPESFQYIDLKYQNIAKDSELEDALQILIYLDLIQNSSSDISPRAPISIYSFEKLAEKIIKIVVTKTPEGVDKKTLLTTKEDLKNIQKILGARTDDSEKKTITISSGISPNTNVFGKKGAILEDVYKTLTKDYYNRAEITTDELIQGAISGLTDSAGDKYTTYFPPIESEEFLEGLEGEYEGIGAYVDMPSPGNFLIVSPIVGSPAEEAGLKGGDVVTHVDENEITKDTSIKEAISWIKGPAGTYVTLTIIREGNNNPLEIKVKRAKIILKDVEYKKLDRSTFYIQIKNFGDKVDGDFKGALETLKEDRQVRKVIFDLRNNPGGYLGKVSTMLSYFVPKGEPTAIVSTGENDINYKSLGFDLIDFSEYELVFLENGGSASASEIMIGTVKDYYPEATIVGEKSFGKGSVQTLKTYYDGSTLKYTSAKWYTGKNRNGIDGIGVIPDIEIPFDDERWKKYKKDNQLEKALDL